MKTTPNTNHTIVRSTWMVAVSTAVAFTPFVVYFQKTVPWLVIVPILLGTILTVVLPVFSNSNSVVGQQKDALKIGAEPVEVKSQPVMSASTPQVWKPDMGELHRASFTVKQGRSQKTDAPASVFCYHDPFHSEACEPYDLPGEGIERRENHEHLSFAA